MLKVNLGNVDVMLAGSANVVREKYYVSRVCYYCLGKMLMKSYHGLPIS